MNTTLRELLTIAVEEAGFGQGQVDWIMRLRELLSSSQMRANCFDLLDAAVKYPALFNRKPETIQSNVIRSADGLGLTAAEFMEAALRQPTLLCMKPETLQSNERGSARALGLTEAQFAAVALKKPQLFCYRPDTLRAKLPYLTMLAEATSSKAPIAALLQMYPIALSFSRSHLHARCVLAKREHGRRAFGSTLVTHNRRTTDAIIASLGEQIATTGSGTRALQVMHANGLIARLPSGISPISRPARRRQRNIATSGPTL